LSLIFPTDDNSDVNKIDQYFDDLTV